MKLIKKQRIMNGRDAWGPMAYADGYLLLRDADRVYGLKILVQDFIIFSRQN
jgi:outer membrane protein assembly factor BamB